MALTRGRPRTVNGNYKAPREYIKEMDLSPKIKLALRAYATGAAKSKREASRLAGLHPQYFTLVTNSGNEKVNDFLRELDAELAGEAVNVQRVLFTAGKRAITNLAHLMENGGSEQVRLKAAQDLADRATEFAKTQKHQVASFQLNSDDIQQLAKALVVGKEVRSEFSNDAKVDYVRVNQSAQPGLIESGGGGQDGER